MADTEVLLIAQYGFPLVVAVVLYLYHHLDVKRMRVEVALLRNIAEYR